MDEESAAWPLAGLPRRLAAVFYDSLLAVAIAFVATFAMLPLTGGEAILASTQGALGHAYRAVLMVVLFAYFGGCWTRSGQTLGMKAWRIQLVGAEGGKLGWTGALGRFLLGTGMTILAVLGAWQLRRPAGTLAAAGAVALLLPLVVNFAWVPFDGAGRSLQDLATGARLRRLR
jgi:uncharacterized RDD family membrane protein YckC